MKNRPLIIGAAVGALVIVLAVAYFSNSPKPGDGSSSPSSTSSATAPTFNGGDGLRNIGLSNDQITNLEQTLEQYLQTQNKHPQTITFQSIAHAGVNRNAYTPIWTISFTVQLDGKSAYRAKTDYFNLNGIRLYLYDPTGAKLLYDSQNVGDSSGMQG